MKTNFKPGARILTISIGMIVGGSAALVMAAPFFQENVPDYTNNKIYRQGQHEGKNDLVKNKYHRRKRNFKIDDDQKAYEAGYQQGRGK
jgi:hypothetical protein